MNNEISLEIVLKQFNDCIPLFTVLTDEIRQSIIMVLAKEPDGLNVNMITNFIPLSRPAVSHHLKILKQAGFVGIKKDGTENYYYLTLKIPIEKMKQLFTYIEGTDYFR